MKTALALLVIFAGAAACIQAAIIYPGHHDPRGLLRRTGAVLGACALGLFLLTPLESRADWFEYVDASVGVSVLPDSSRDCTNNGGRLDGDRQLVSRASLVANVYQADGLTVDAHLWDHVGCGASLDSGQAFGGPGLSVTYRLWSR